MSYARHIAAENAAGNEALVMSNWDEIQERQGMSPLQQQAVDFSRSYRDAPPDPDPLGRSIRRNRGR